MYSCDFIALCFKSLLTTFHLASTFGTKIKIQCATSNLPQHLFGNIKQILQVTVLIIMYKILIELNVYDARHFQNTVKVGINSRIKDNIH